jgi:membrane protease YdiL (CAAX protease family)
MKMLNGNLTLFLMLFSFAVALLAIYLVVKHLHNQHFLTLTTSRNSVDWKRIFFSFGVWAVFTIISVAIGYFSEPENFVINFKPVPFLILLVISLIMIPIQTSTEEYVFRGYLMQGFANLSMNKWFPLLMTSLIFGLLHIANPEVQKMGAITMVYYIGTGLLLGIMTLMDDGMELALGFHAANNLISALLITSDWTAFQTDSILKDKSTPSAGFEIILPVFIVFPLILFIFSKKYNWSNWKEKLFGKIEIENPNLKIESHEYTEL